MGMIKIGHRVINTDAIAHIDLENCQRFRGEDVIGVLITLISTYEELSGREHIGVSEKLFFHGEEAEALRWYYRSADNAANDVVEMYKNPGTLSQLKEKTEFSATHKAGLAEIKEVAQKLAELPNVERVRAIARSPNDLHEVIFELLPSNIDSPENGELAKKAISLVIDAEWKLSDITDNESWLFGVQMVGEFEFNPNENRVVASSF